MRVLILLGLWLGAGAVDAASPDAAWCEQQWLAESAQYADRDDPDYSGLLQAWQQMADKCRGSVVYEARLADIYLQLSQPGAAHDAVAGVEGRPSPYAYLVELTDLLVQLKEMQLAHQMDEVKLREMEGKLMQFVHKYPDAGEGYGILGFVQTLLHEYAAAVPNVELAQGKLPERTGRVGILRNLTISYAQTERYADAYAAAGKALKLRRGLTSDQYFAYAVARAQAGLGKVQEADTTLHVILSKKPEVREDPQFAAAVHFVLEKKQQDVGAR